MCRSCVHAGRKAGVRAGSAARGALPAATNNRLRTGTDKGNPTV